MLDTGYHLDDRDGTISRPPSAHPHSTRSASLRAGLVAPYHQAGIRKRRGFTLLEITLAVAILGMMSLTIFRFVQSNLTALSVSSDVNAAEAQYDGFRDLLMAEWQSLSPRRAGMKGEPFKLNDRKRDEISWNCSAGPGLLTRYAPGNFTVSLRLQPENSKSNRLDLGFLRKPQKDSDIGEAHESWVPLIRNVNTLQILYFDPRLNTWIDRWSDGSRLPRLIKLTVGRADATMPWEVIIPLGRIPWDLLTMEILLRSRYPLALRQSAEAPRHSEATTTASQGRGVATALGRRVGSWAAML